LSTWLNRIRIHRDAWVAFAKSRVRSAYHFTADDCRLHIQERLWQAPPIRVCEDLDDCFRLAVQNREIFWPKSLSYTGIGWLYNEIFIPWSLNPASYSHPQTQVPVGGWVIDAGACEGFFSMHALERGARHVLAIEPVASLGATLTKTFAQAQREGRLAVLEQALADTTGVSYLHAEVAQVWDSTLQHDATNTSDVCVDATTIDRIVMDHGLRENGLIKMDIEGAEMVALQGATNTLRKHRPRLAVAVYHSYENALRCREIILTANPDYHVDFRGMYAWFSPPRPYLLFAW